MLMIKESDGIADSHFMPTQSLLRILSNADVDAIKIDGCVGDQPVLPCVGFTNQHVLGSELAYLCRAKLICSGIEILDFLDRKSVV